jgi:hypothetical protein
VVAGLDAGELGAFFVALDRCAGWNRQRRRGVGGFVVPSVIVRLSLETDFTVPESCVKVSKPGAVQSQAPLNHRIRTGDRLDHNQVLHPLSCTYQVCDLQGFP